MTHRAKNVGQVRRLRDKELIELFFDDSASRAVSHRVILERMKDRGDTEFAVWVWDRESLDPISKKNQPVDDEPYWIIARTGQKETLSRELTAILHSSYPFHDVKDPERCKEFCSERGNVLDMYERELSAAQARMLGLIRDRANRFLRRKRG